MKSLKKKNKSYNIIGAGQIKIKFLLGYIPNYKKKKKFKQKFQNFSIFFLVTPNHWLVTQTMKMRVIDGKYVWFKLLLERSFKFRHCIWKSYWQGSLC